MINVDFEQGLAQLPGKKNLPLQQPVLFIRRLGTETEQSCCLSSTTNNQFVLELPVG